MLFEQAETAYAAGELDEAVALLLQARELLEDPTLLYNLARCYEGLGRLGQAAQAYRQFLAEAEDPPARGAIEQRIAAIDQELRAREAAERQRAEDRARAEAAERRALEHERSVRRWPWLFASLGLASMVGAVVTGPLALHQRSEAGGAADQRAGAEAFQTAERLALTTNVLWAIGGVLLVTGAALLIYDFVRLRRVGRASAWVRGLPWL